MKKYSALVLFLFLVAYSAQAQDAESASLKGPGPVEVLVETLPPDAEGAGLTRDQLKTDVELRLRRSRIKVAPSPFGYLYVNIDALKISGPESLVYSVHVGVSQAATLDGNKAGIMGPTWSNGMVGPSPSGDFAAKVRGVVGDEVDKFINDYLAVNE